MQRNESGLAIVFRNSAPRRESQYATTWLSHAGDRPPLKLVVCSHGASRPRIVHKEAA